MPAFVTDSRNKNIELAEGTLKMSDYKYSDMYDALTSIAKMVGVRDIHAGPFSIAAAVRKVVSEKDIPISDSLYIAHAVPEGSEVDNRSYTVQENPIHN